MKVLKMHPWQVTINEAACLQRELSKRLQFRPLDLDRISYIAGADVSFSRGSDAVYAAAVVLSFPDLKIAEEKTSVVKATFPYIPGFLTFREGPALVEVFKKVETIPDVIVFDGQGIAHPRGFGIASHMGLLLDKPSIGCAKSPLVGKYVEPGKERGSVSPLLKDGKEIGAVLRTRTGVAPVFVSAGNHIDLPSSINIILRCAPRYRLPEPIRRAHFLSNKARIKK